MKKTSPVLRAAETVMRVLLTACGLAAVGFVIVITGYLVVSGIPAIREVGLIEFLAGTVWKPSTDQFGILPVILTSVLGTFGAILIGVPLGLLFAIYLGKMAPKPVYQVLRPTVDLLSGIPSVVYGLVGMMVLVPFVREAFHVADGVGLFSSIIVLTVMVLPSIISVSETALKAVIEEYYPDVEVLMGTSTAGIAHAAITAHLMNLPMGYVRSGHKDHGRGNQIEGKLEKGQKVVVVEDLISTGGSVLEVVDVLREAGADVLGVASIFTYGMQKGLDRLAAANVINHSLSNFDTLCEVAAEEGYIKPEDIARLKKFRQNPSDESWMNG